MSGALVGYSNHAVNYLPIFVEIIQGMTVTPPSFTGYNPAKSATNIALDTNIYFEIDAGTSNVDNATITVTVEGANAILNGAFQSGYLGTIVSDGSGGYDVTINPDTDFSYSQVVNITIDVDDLLGNPATQDVYSFTCVTWAYPGLTRPSIVYDGNTINFPLPISCQLNKKANNNINIGLNKSVEVINVTFPQEMRVVIEPVFDTAFIAAMKTFFNNWAGQGKWFTFTSGQNARYDGNWLLMDREWKPTIGSNGSLSYSLTFWRP